MPALLLIAVPLLATQVLGSDYPYFIVWWLVWTLSGIIFWPLASLFVSGHDAGFAVAKIMGPMIITIIVCWFSGLGFLPFTRYSLLILYLSAAIVIWGWPQINKKFRQRFVVDLNPKLIIAEEIIFASILLLWAFARGLKPELDSLEKMMNLGFLNSLWRSSTLPALDMWFAGETINYYYGGHILTSILMKISGIKPQISYNLALSSTMALTGTLSFTLGYQILQRHCREKRRFLPWFSGTIVALLICFGGNGHSILYDTKSPLHPMLRKIAGILPNMTGNVDSFWFSDSTRFIGHNPPVEDFTIHEFPYYSFLVADLHAHLLNLACVIGLLIIITSLWRRGWLQEKSELWDRELILKLARNEETDSKKIRISLAIAEVKGSFSDTKIWLLAVFLACFMMTNFWDFIIYFALISWLSWLITHSSTLPLIRWQALPVFIIQVALIMTPFLMVKSPLLALFLYLVAAIINHLLLIIATDRLSYAAAKVSALFALAHLIALPFNLNFSAISKTIKLTDRHTSLYQFLVVWGVMLGAGFIWCLSELLLVRQYALKENESKKAENQPSLSSDTIFLLRSDRILLSAIFVAAVILLIIPELIYVKDIYGADYQRSNTMFKFTYQAFVLLMLIWGVGLSKMIANWRQSTARKVVVILLVLAMIVPFWYPFTATEQWLGTFTPENYISLDGTTTLRNKNSSEISGDNVGELKSYFTLIDWINNNIKGQPVIIEAVSVSYSDFNLVSAFTGLPTVVGWPTHEWLWRQTPDNPDAWANLVAPRIDEVRQVYTDPDHRKVLDILKKYKIEYIVLGALERELYSSVSSEIPVANEIFLRSLGTAVFDQDGTCLIKFAKSD